MKYWKPNSMTFWSGITLIIQGLLPVVEGQLPDWMKLSQGLGLIGVRAAIK